MWVDESYLTSKKINAFCSWSGGKESALSFYRAQRNGVLITGLINMLSEDGKHSRSHGLNPELLKQQGLSAKVPILQRKTTWEGYEKKFKKAILKLKEKSIIAGVFGDIDIQEHRDWIERICKETEIEPILPLWGENREDLLLEFIEAGFKAIVVTVNSEFLDEGWLGRGIDKKFISDLEKTSHVDLCGEKGEYHTFVYDGPIFQSPIEFTIGKRILKNKHWFLELIPKVKKEVKRLML